MRRKSLLALFFLSGISSLIYEICWVRQATLTFGVSIYAYSAVLTAYMGGMAIGGYLIGKRADRTAHPLRLFAWLQAGLAELGLLAPFALDGLTTLYAAVARQLNPGLTVLTALRLGMSLLALAPPAICIGAALPVMSRAYARHSGRVGRDVGGLYAANTFGSVLGCVLTAIFLIRLLGLRETVFLASAIHLLVAAAAWGLARGGAGAARPQRERARARRAKTPAPTPAALRFLLWAYALSGFASLGYEVVWARIISLHTVGAAYSIFHHAGRVPQRAGRRQPGRDLVGAAAAGIAGPPWGPGVGDWPVGRPGAVCLCPTAPVQAGRRFRRVLGRGGDGL